MAKKKATDKPFRLSGKAGAMLNSNIAELRKGIINVCELHSYDNDGSMDKTHFETTYIEHVFGQPITAVSASIRAMTASLQAKAEQVLQVNGDMAQ